MANDSTPVTFLDIHSNSFYFSEETHDWETDAFKKCEMIWKYQIKSKDNKSLILYDKRDFQFENSTAHQFNVQPYNRDAEAEAAADQNAGRVVMLYVYKDEQKMVACCCGESEVCAKAMELPTDIKGTSHEALFYMKALSTPSYYTFQSTLDKSRFLGFQVDVTNPSRHKLVLIQDKDEVDENGPLQMLEQKE